MKRIAVLIALVSFNINAEEFPSVQKQVTVLCRDHQKPQQCKQLLRKMLASSYRVHRAAQACTSNPDLPYCEDIFKDASDLDKWGK